MIYRALELASLHFRVFISLFLTNERNDVDEPCASSPPPSLRLLPWLRLSAHQTPFPLLLPVAVAHPLPGGCLLAWYAQRHRLHQPNAAAAADASAVALCAPTSTPGSTWMHMIHTCKHTHTLFSSVHSFSMHRRRCRRRRRWRETINVVYEQHTSVDKIDRTEKKYVCVCVCVCVCLADAEVYERTRICGRRRLTVGLVAKVFENQRIEKMCRKGGEG